MAMKVTSTLIYRVGVDLSCGCKMYAEFEDAQCKKPMGSTLDPDPEGPDIPIDKIFKVCPKHEKDTSLSMLEFIIGERLDEAIESTQKNPIHTHNLSRNTSIEEGDTGGVVAVGANVQSVAKLNKPDAVGRSRANKPPEIKTLHRSTTQLAKAGAAPIHVTAEVAEMQIDEVPEDAEVTPQIDQFLDGLEDPESDLP